MEYVDLLLCTALEDDTDELLELIAKSDSLHTPTKQHHHSSRVLMYKQHGRSSNSHVHPSHSYSSSDTDSNKSTKFSDEAAAYSDLKVKANFTPAPVSYSDQPYLDRVNTPNFPIALDDLVELMQG